MQLVGKAVKHNAFGDGIITDCSDQMVTICFSQGDKRFVYPDAFMDFLFLQDQSTQHKIKEKWQARQKEKNAQKDADLEMQELRDRLRHLKITANSQAVLEVTPETLDQIFVSGTASAGCFASGLAKGKPRIPSKLKPNSACLLTICPPDVPEKERQIAGVFMAAEDFWGDLCEDGIIKIHEKYAVRLRAPQPILFWSDSEQETAAPKRGTAVFRYMANDTMHQTLWRLQSTMQGTEQEAEVRQFYQYFCEINRLPDLQSILGE